MNSNLNVQQNNVQVGDKKFEIFNYQNLGQVRTIVDQSGATWFSLPDVCGVLDIKSHWNVVSRIEDPYLHTTEIGVQTGVFPDGSPIMQNVNMNFVNESGLYQAIGHSRKPEAKRFMRWVLEEVIPSIRQKGYYTLQPMTPVQMIRTLADEVIKQQAIVDKHGEIICVHGERLDQHDMLFEMYNNQIEILSHEGYFTIATHAKFRNIPISLETAQTLGTIATKICEERGIGVASIPHPTFNFIHAYPYEILNEVFSNYFSN